jgi:hypothetical protein
MAHIGPPKSVCANEWTVQAFELAPLKQGNRAPYGLGGMAGWGGRIRTYGTRYQKALPYHLATPHQRGRDTQIPTGDQPSKVIILLFLGCIIAQQVFADADLAFGVDHTVKCAFSLGADRGDFYVVLRR